MDDERIRGVLPPGGRIVRSGHDVAYGPVYPELAPEPEGPHIRDYWRVILKRKRVIATFFIILVSVVTIASFVKRPVFRATTTIKIERETPNVLSFDEVMSIRADIGDFYETQYKILESRAIARKVIDKLDLVHHPEYSESIANILAGDKPDRQRIADEVLIRSVQNSVDVQPMKDSRLVNVSFLSPDKFLTADAANAVARAYVDLNFEDKYSATEQAREFLASKLDELKLRVAESERALQKYGKGKDILALDERQNIIVQKLNELNKELAAAEFDRMKKEALYLDTSGKNPDEIPAVLENKLVQDLKNDYQELEREYNEKSKKFKPAYPAMVRLQHKMDREKEMIRREIANVIEGIRHEHESALAREKSVYEGLEKQKAEVRKLNESAIEYGILKNEVDTNRKIYNAMLQRTKEASIAAGLKASNISVIDRADVPLGKYRPRRKLNILLGMILGLIGGVGLAFFFEYLDNTINTPDEVERVFHLPSIGVIPALGSALPSKGVKLLPGRGGNVTSPVETVSHSDSHSIIAEAYRSVRTSLLLSDEKSVPRVVLVTSSMPGEGKTTASINIAITFCQTGLRVLLIDADLRRPGCHRALQVDNSRGLSDYLRGELGWRDVVKPTSIRNLSILTCGPVSRKSGDLLMSERMRLLITEAASDFDHIILDTAPVIGFSDTVILSTMADGVILVVEGSVTPKDLVLRTKALLREVNATIFGVIINNVEVGKDPYYYYSHYYYYSYGEGERRKRKKRGSRKTARNTSVKENVDA